MTDLETKSDNQLFQYVDFTATLNELRDAIAVAWRKNWFVEHGYGTDTNPWPNDLRVQLSVYAVDRKYGGPEEGGWWYNWYTFTGISARVHPEEIESERERLLAMFADDQPRYDIYSAANDGPQFEVLQEDKAGESQTTVRPHYE